MYLGGLRFGSLRWRVIQLARVEALTGIKMQTSSRLKSGSTGSGTIRSPPHLGQVAIRSPPSSVGRDTRERVHEPSGAALTLRLAAGRSCLLGCNEKPYWKYSTSLGPMRSFPAYPVGW